MTWIKTNDEIPDRHVAVLAYFRDKCYVAYCEDGWWYMDEDGEPATTPTHWMPLPEPPK